MFGRDPLDPAATEALRALEMQLEAGVELPRALRSAGRIGDANVNRAFHDAIERAQAGAGPEEVVEALRPVLPRVDRAVLRAGWAAGGPEQATQRVLNRRRTLHSSRRLMRSQLVLPAAVLVIASLIAPLPDLLLGGSLAAYLSAALAPLLIIGGLGGGVAAVARWRAWDEREAASGPGWGERITRALPLLGGAERWHGLGVAALVLSDLLEAGLVASRALQETARALPGGFERKGLAEAAERVAAGEPVDRALEALAPPREWREAIAVGEESGQFEQVLRRLGGQGLEHYEQRMRALGRWLPRIAYALVALYVIQQILSLAMGVIGRYPG